MDLYEEERDIIVKDIIKHTEQKLDAVKTAMKRKLYIKAHAIANQAKGMIESLECIIDIDADDYIMHLLEQANNMLYWVETRL